MFTLLDSSGSLKRQVNSTHVVNLWIIPHGERFDNTKTMNVFFPDKESADIFSSRWETIPEMACVMTISQYDRIIADRIMKQPCARCGDYRDGHIDRHDAFPGQCDTWVMGQSSDTD